MSKKPTGAVTLLYNINKQAYNTWGGNKMWQNIIELL